MSNNDHNYKEFRTLVSSLSPIPDKEWDWLVPRLKRKEFEPRGALFKFGEIDSSLYCIVQGLVRYYYLTQEGQERNHTFAIEKSLVACLPSFVELAPCSFTVEAIEKTTTIFISSKVVQEMNSQHECWLRLKLKLMEHAALRRQEREAEFLVASAENRYLNFRSKYPALEQRIPQYQIASYLGITPVALSRIRKRIIS